MSKSLLLTLSILILCISVNQASAKGYKPPKRICYNLSNTSGDTTFDNGTLVMLSKSLGMKAKSIDGNVTFYDVKASIGVGPTNAITNLTGSAYVDLGDNNYEGNMTGFYYPFFYGCEFYYSITSETMTIWRMRSVRSAAPILYCLSTPPPT